MSDEQRPARVVLITGAAGGIGSKLVEQFLADQDIVIAADADGAGLDALRGRWPSAGNLTTVRVDVSVESDCAALADRVRDRAGRVDVLVNCAGLFAHDLFEDMSLEQWRRVLDVNLTGPFLVTRAVLPLMKDIGRGRIITFGSASVFDGTAGQVHYVAANAGLVGFTRALRREVGKYGITVNLVTPGVTMTQSVREAYPPFVFGVQREQRALQRDEQPEDLVGVVVFLASDAAAFITGQTINVDGGKFVP